MTTQTRNEVLLEGIALEAPALSHENHGTRFYRFPLQVPRLSGTPDTLPVLVPEALLTAVRLEDPLRVRGQLRSFNNRSGVGNRLVLTVQAARLQVGDTLSLEGRVQSRTYRKVLEDGTAQERVAYEVSAMHLLEPEAAE